MEKYTMFMDRKNQYSENEYTTQSNLQIQCNPYQATRGIFHRARTNNFTICMEIQKTLNSQSNHEKKEWNSRNQPASLQALLQSHSHQDSMVLAAAAAKSLQSCPTLCDPREGSPPGSPVPGILQARILSGLPFPSPMHKSEKGK